MLDFIYPLVLIIGFTTLAVVYLYNYLLKKVLHVMINLFNIEINSKENLQEYIDEISLYLREIGIIDIIYDLSYSQTLLQNKIDEKKYILVKQKIKDDLIRGEICLHVKTDRGERKIINRLILHIVSMQIVRFIHYKIRTINESFEQMAKLQTYMIHDMKNILQFFQAMQYNVANINDDVSRDRFIEFLQNSTEPINHKVNKILSLLKIKSYVKTLYTQNTISIATVFNEYIKLYKLTCKVQGDAQTKIAKEHIETIADNILRNIADKMFYEKDITCNIIISHRDKTLSIIIKDSGEAFKKVSQISEPFFTTKEQGIGIGLYQVKSIIILLQGKINFENQDNHPRISIKLPHYKKV
jgi:signal transduction histidine kinase